MSSSETPPPVSKPVRPFVVRPPGAPSGAQPAQPTQAPGVRPLSRVSRPFIPRVVQAAARPDPRAGGAASDATASAAPPAPHDAGVESTASPVAAADAWADRPLRETPAPALDTTVEDEGSGGRTTAQSESVEVLDAAAAFPSAEPTIGESAVAFDASPETEAVIPGAEVDAADAAAPPAFGHEQPAPDEPVAVAEFAPHTISHAGMPEQAVEHDGGPGDEPWHAPAQASEGGARPHLEHTPATPEGERLASGVVPPAQAWPDDVWSNEDAAGLGIAAESVPPAGGGPTPLPETLAAELATAVGPAPDELAGDPGTETWDATLASLPPRDVVSAAEGAPPGTAEANPLADRLEQLAEQVRSGRLAANTSGDAADQLRDSEVLVALLGAVLKAGR